MIAAVVAVLVAAAVVVDLRGGAFGASSRAAASTSRRSAPTPRPRRRDPIERWREWRTRRALATPDALAEWLDEVARTVRRGASSAVALAVVPADPRVALDTLGLRRDVSRGGAVAAAAEAWRVEHDSPTGRRRTTPAISLCAAVIACATEVGGSLAEPVDRLASAMRERAQLDRDRRTHSAQARLSAVVLSCLPLAVLGALLAADPEVRRVAVSPVGVAVIGLGVILDSVGAWWMHRIAGTLR